MVPTICAERDCLRQQEAFTLIELLVVTVIVGIVSSFLLLSFGLLSNDRALDQQARRLGSLLELSLDEAELQGRDFGLELMRGGYRFVELDPVLDEWSEIPGDDMLKPRQLDDGMQLELFVEDRRVLLAEEPAKLRVNTGQENNSKVAKDYAPHVLILSSGDLSPFSLKILRDSDKSSKTLTVTPAGEIKIDVDERDGT